MSKINIDADAMKKYANDFIDNTKNFVENQNKKLQQN